MLILEQERKKERNVRNRLLYFLNQHDFIESGFSHVCVVISVIQIHCCYIGGTGKRGVVLQKKWTDYSFGSNII